MSWVRERRKRLWHQRPLHQRIAQWFKGKPKPVQLHRLPWKTEAAYRSIVLQIWGLGR